MDEHVALQYVASDMLIATTNDRLTAFDPGQPG